MSGGGNGRGESGMRKRCKFKEILLILHTNARKTQTRYKISRMNNQYSTYTLGNGLRLACRQTSGFVSYIGALVNVGSRDESAQSHGLAHFVEHTIFKGTEKRRSWQVSNRMESIGGELNAYTSKEETMIYTNAPSGYEERAVELIADLVSNSVFPEEEIEKERDVVVEEINSYLDSPSDSVYDEFEELAYAGSGLSHNILGSAESVRSLRGEDCRRFVREFYTPSEIVVYCCGPASPEKMYRLVEKYFGGMDRPDAPRRRALPPAVEPFCLHRDRGNHQANTIVGARLFGRRDSRRYALFLLNNYLGGPCMNSRLNRELREKRGLVYTVDSSVGLLSDTGLMLIYFGCDPQAVEKCRKIIFAELDKLAQSPMSASTFEKIKRQYCGQLLVSSDHIESRAMSLAKSMAYYGEIHDISTITRHISEVTAEEMMEVARLVTPGNCCSLTLT